MDPEAAYAKIRTITQKHSASSWTTMTLDEVMDLADAVEALDGWLRAGGFLPLAWERAAKGLKP